MQPFLGIRGWRLQGALGGSRVRMESSLVQQAGVLGHTWNLEGAQKLQLC